MSDDLQAIRDFLQTPTPDTWIEAALANQELMLIDHANCEKKAAGTALNLMFRYVEYGDLQHRMSRLAREELRHYEQVLRLMKNRGVDYRYLSASRYAEGLRRHMRGGDPARLADVLVIGAYIEARSCERFAALAPLLDDELAKFYRSLLASEARHFQDYLNLAREAGAGPIEERIRFFGSVEAELITAPDQHFRFHGGPPVAAVA